MVLFRIDLKIRELNGLKLFLLNKEVLYFGAIKKYNNYFFKITNYPLSIFTIKLIYKARSR